MNLERKLELTAANVRSISRHDDEPKAAVFATLDAVVALVAEEKALAEKRRAARPAAG
jgi:hypothetical protein